MWVKYMAKTRLTGPQKLSFFTPHKWPPYQILGLKYVQIDQQTTEIFPK